MLIITEPADASDYDPQVSDALARHAEELGAEAQILEARLASGPDDIPDEVLNGMQHAEHTLFLSRLGDQIRFSPAHGAGTKTVAYIRDLDYLGSLFGCTPFALFQAVRDRLLEIIQSASSYRISSSAGTELVGHVNRTNPRATITEFAVTCFPMVIYPPLNCYNLTGTLVLERFLMSTSVHDYESSVLLLDEPVKLHIDNSVIVGFSGARDLVGQVEAHYHRVAEHFGGDPMAVHSWHTGIYPATYHSGHWQHHTASWGEITFASPRYTHFHTCGDDPGNIATATFDATIEFDDELMWEAGVPVFLDRPEMKALLHERDLGDEVYALRRDIGL